ncbi:argininosuccinate lyase [Nitratireductor aquibiodomus RA22]|uniref:Argininosuccinate lyase n=1 Tax=Nitratireductor aquibiodomus RA22 TaxID=1189611 RepID=I5C571_9HYPH|nr:argininosuccinate lyase [Nitratireductor aquibiodomus]EIM76973.1 argininosuccinate lyase [Nitratireductor aquibiodomus RA22]
MPSASKVSPRLSQPLAQEVLDLVFTPRIARELASGVEDLCALSEAHLVMLSRKGFIDRQSAATIASALLGMRQDGMEAVKPDPAREDGYFNFEAELMSRAGVEAGGRLHVARSRNDINATIDRISARRALATLAGLAIELRTALLERAARFADAVMPGYTHLQPAQPITYGFYLVGVANALERDTERLFSAYTAANRCPLGACALAGTSFAIDRDLLADLLGFDGLHLHAQDAVASRDYAWDIAGAVLSLATNWGRFSQDLYIWGTQEFGLVRFSDSIAGTSSIMPQKKNPVAIEYLKAASGDVLGGVASVFTVLKGGHFTHAGDTGRSALAPLWSSLRLAGDALRIATLVANEAEPLTAAMQDRADGGFSTATDLADSLVREAGVSFREAHHAIADLVRMALERGLDPSQISGVDIGEALARSLGRHVDIDLTAAANTLDPVKSVAGRRSPGAASPGETARMLQIAQQRVVEDRGRLDGLVNQTETARRRLAAAVETLLQES